MTVDEQFTVLNEKVQRLLQQYHRAQREVEKLREAVKEAQAKEGAANTRAEELQQQVAILQLAAGEMHAKDKRIFERRLAQYIKEIDRTIAYLSE
jgi:lipid II:glycine glycyltransferase (peptidoglycan interpeptide bridge formation enzyme)